MPNPDTSPPHTTPCGGTNQPACPPTPALVQNGVKYWTEDQILRHGTNCHAKGVVEGEHAQVIRYQQAQGKR